MASKIDLTGINNFRQKLQKYNNFSDYASRLVAEILEEGKRIAENEYAGVSDVLITTDQDGTVGKIIAKGDQVAYIEFGTGAYAGEYEGKLPTSGVPITNKWSYYYDNPLYKRTVDGEKGWFTTQKEKGVLTFEIGQKAGNQMYRVSKKLQEALPTIVGRVK